MNKGLSLYLDFCRLSAAGAVVLGHAHGYILPSIPKALAGHAEEGVAVFFVLSGFVISFVAAEKEQSFIAFARARFVRMFSVVPLALIVTYLLDSIGQLINAPYYTSISFFREFSLASLLGAITFTNELWYRNSVFGSNHAYWSLGYEVPYYFAFAAMHFLPRRIAVPMLVAWCLIVGPGIALYFLLWAIGCITYNIVKRRSFGLKTSTAIILFVASLVIYCVVKLNFNSNKLAITRSDVDVLLFIYSFTYYMGVALAVGLSIFSVSQIRVSSAPSICFLFARRLKWLAGGSFTLYLLHQPMVTFAGAIFPDIKETPGIGLVSLIVIVIATYFLAEFGERRKNYYTKILRFAN